MEPGPSVLIEARKFCYKCFRSASTCYCPLIRSVESNVEFLILQHPKERFKAIGTARMAHLCLKNSRLLEGISFLEHPVINSLLKKNKGSVFLLYPGRQALNLHKATFLEIQNFCGSVERKITIIVIDGTWDSAQKIFSNNPQFHELPQISLSPSQPSQYRIRKQPNLHALSTLEAIYETLKILRPHVDASPLSQVFQFMIQTQLKFVELRGQNDTRHFMNSRARKLKILNQGSQIET